LDRLGKGSLPYAWLLVGATVVAVVSIYNRFSVSQPLPTVYGASVLVSSSILGGLLCAPPTELFTMLLYIWKDVYIVVLIEIFWTVANTYFDRKSAPRIYGLFLVVGSLGSMAGNFGVGYLAEWIGLERVLWGVIPLTIIAWSALLPFGPVTRAQRQSAPAKLTESYRVLRQSRVLILMLALIALVQVVITLVDYQFNAIVEASYPDEKKRAGIIGQVYGAIDIGAIALQIGSGLVIATVGLKGVLLGIPGLIGLTVLGLTISPVFLFIAVGKIGGKVFDYSLFRVAKEMLYLPLSYPEKTQGKAFIDMMGYRVAKAAGSLMLLGLMALGGDPWLGLVTFGFVIAWFLVTLALVRSGAADGPQAPHKN
jgi:AAA family ATP:ADP antiporter